MIDSELPPGTMDSAEWTIEMNEFDSITLPSMSFTGKTQDSTVETEEHKIQYKLTPFFRELTIFRLT